MTEFVPHAEIPAVIVVKPKRFGDDRGYFEETFVSRRYADNGISCVFVQENHSLSAKCGVVRGLHFQIPPHAQDKLVRCTRGRVLDIAVDIRTDSNTFGKYVAVELSAANGFQLFVPKGFAHAFCTLEENCEVQYKVSDYYAPECDAGIAFNDKDVGIDWPFSEDQLTLSDKDKSHPMLSEYKSPFVC